MTVRRLPIAPPAVDTSARRPWEDVLGVPASGASPSGSTFWKRMRRCPREHALYSIAKLRRTARSEPLTVGALWHLGLEHYYRARMAGLGGEAEEQAMLAIRGLADEPGYEETFPEVVRLLLAYFEAYRQEDAGWRIVAVEETLSYSDELTMRYSARLDLLIERQGGLWIVEHKTARAITADLLSGYQMDMQILGQVWLFDRCVDTRQYPPLRGVLVNIESKHRPPRFERVEVCPSRDHLAAFEQSMQQWAVVEKFWASLGWPKALGNCTGGARYFTQCDYFDLCHGFPSDGVERFAAEEPPYGFVRGETALEVDDGEG